MKKLFFLLIFLSLQNVSAQKKYGAYAGINYSFFTDGFAKQSAGEDSFGFNIGGYYETPLSSKVSFRPGLALSQEGDRTHEAQDGIFELDDVNLELTYLNIPLDFKFWNNIYVIAGPQIGFVVMKDAPAGYPKKADSPELGLNLGLGFTVHDFFAEWGVHQGLTDVMKYPYEVNGTVVHVRNTYAKFVVGWRF